MELLCDRQFFRKRHSSTDQDDETNTFVNYGFYNFFASFDSNTFCILWMMCMNNEACCYLWNQDDDLEPPPEEYWNLLSGIDVKAGELKWKQKVKDHRICFMTVSLSLIFRSVTRSGITTSSMWSSQWWRSMWTEWPTTPTWWRTTGPSTPPRLMCSWQSGPAGKVGGQSHLVSSLF